MKKKIVAGIMVTVFLLTLMFTAAPVGSSPGKTIKIGVIGPKGWAPYDGVYEAALLFKDWFEGAGGVTIGGQLYDTITLVTIDEHSVPVPAPQVGIAELLDTLTTHTDLYYMVGGFRSECVIPIRDACMDFAAENGRPIWVVAGSAAENTADCGGDYIAFGLVPHPACGACCRCNYNKYKYVFRPNPMNGTAVVMQFAAMMQQRIIPKLWNLYKEKKPGALVENKLPVYLLIEDVISWDSIYALLSAVPHQILGTQVKVVGKARPSSIESDFAPYLSAISASGAKLIMHIFSTVGGAAYISAWGRQPFPAATIGVNVESQMQEFYAGVGGLCEYEGEISSVGTATPLSKALMAAGFNPVEAPIPVSTDGFWLNYTAKFGHGPIYTSWGAIDGLLALWQALGTGVVTAWPPASLDPLIKFYETNERNIGLVGKFRYNGPGGKYHDFWVNPDALSPIWPSGYARGHMVQWYRGKMNVIWPIGYKPKSGAGSDPAGKPLPFARKYRIPPWLYSLGETDFRALTGDIYPYPAPLTDVPLMLPDGTVGTPEISLLAGLWLKTPPWWYLEADMDDNNFIDLDDVTRVALDYGKTAVPA